MYDIHKALQSVARNQPFFVREEQKIITETKLPVGKQRMGSIL